MLNVVESGNSRKLYVYVQATLIHGFIPQTRLSGQMILHYVCGKPSRPEHGMQEGTETTQRQQGFPLHHATVAIQIEKSD